MDLNEVPNDQTGLKETKIEEKIKGLNKNKGALDGVNSSELSLNEWKRKYEELELQMAELKRKLKEDSSMNGASDGAMLIKEFTKEEQSKKYLDLIGKSNLMRVAHSRAQRVESTTPLRTSPKNSKTITEGLEEALTNEEARVLLEKRKFLEPHLELKREEPRKKSKARKTQRGSSSHEAEDAAPQGSTDTICTVVSISKHRPAVEVREEVISSPGNKPILQPTHVPKNKGKEKVGESSEASTHSQEEVYWRHIRPYRNDVPFLELGQKDMIARYSQATRNLLGRRDIEYLDSLNPVERIQQASAAAAEALLRLTFELSHVQQNAVDRDTLDALTSQINDQNIELEKLRKEVEVIPSLKEKLASYKDLFERLALDEKWKGHIREHLDEVGQKLDRAANMAIKIHHDVAEMLDAHDKTVQQNEHFAKLVLENMDRFERVLEAAKVHKLRSERQARIAWDWLASDDGSKFLLDLSSEIVSAGGLIAAEKYKLAATEMGYDFDQLQKLAESKTESALNNLSEVLDQDFEVMNDPTREEQERLKWSQTLDAAKEKRSLSLDLEKVLVTYPSMPKTTKRVVFSKLEKDCFDLTNVLLAEKEIFKTCLLRVRSAGIILGTPDKQYVPTVDNVAIKAEKSCDQKVTPDSPVTPAKPKPLSAAVIDIIDSDERDVHASHRSNPPSEGISAMMPEEYGVDETGGIMDGGEKSGGTANTASVTPMTKRVRDLMVVTSDDDSEDYERKPSRRAIKIENSDAEDEDGNDITPVTEVLGGVPSESEDDDDDRIPLSRLKRKRSQVSRQPAGASNSNQPRRRLVKIGQVKMEDRAQEIENDDESSSESSLNSSNSFIVDDSDDEDLEDDELKEGGDDSYDQEQSSDSDLDYADIISKFRSRRNPNSKWIHEGDMLSDFGKNPVLCMKAVCALYRLQTNEEKACKISLFHNGRGFSRIDATSGTHLGEFLTDGDPKGDLVKSVEELKKHDRNGVEECRRLANHYSKQLFKIYESREDPFFP